MKKLSEKPSIQTRSQTILRCFVVLLMFCAGIIQVGASTLKFGSAEVRFSEGIGVVFVPLEWTNPTGGEQVTIQTADLDATAGVDYVAINEVYTFGANETEISIAVKILDNPQFQADRSLKLTLSNPAGLTLGSPSETTLFIEDNDDSGMAGPGAASTNLYQGTFAIATNNLGRVILGGGFDTFNGQTMTNLARLLPDGSLDPAFTPGAGPDNRVLSLAVEPDDQIVIGGDFTMVGGVPRNRIARLNNDGTVDAQFNPGTGANGPVESLQVMADGRLLVGGPFSKINDVDRSDVAILSSAGALDPAFIPVVPKSLIGRVAVRTGNHILLGGEMDRDVEEDAHVTNIVVRLDVLTGSRDNSFKVAVGDIFYNIVSGIAVQPDGKILICGLFSSVNDVRSSCIARLKTDGTYDETFNVGGGANYWIERVALQADGKILLGGLFSLIDETPRGGVARLNSDGSLDDTFNPRGGANEEVVNAFPLPDGRVMLTGVFTAFDGYDRFRFATLNSDGSLYRAPLNITDYSLVPGNELQMKVAVEPGRDFRIFSTENFAVRSLEMTGRTARHSVEIEQAVSGPKKFFYVEQGD
jgi:uncharacterized delta-60 repeat protein